MPYGSNLAPAHDDTKVPANHINATYGGFGGISELINMSIGGSRTKSFNAFESFGYSLI